MFPKRKCGVISRKKNSKNHFETPSLLLFSASHYATVNYIFVGSLIFTVGPKVKISKTTNKS